MNTKGTLSLTNDENTIRDEQQGFDDHRITTTAL